MLAGLRTLIVGTGSIAVRHAQVLRSLGVQEIYVFSRSKRTLRVEGIRVILIAEEEIPLIRFDLTVICSKTQNHHLDLLLAARNSELILIEKPLAGSMDDLDRIALATPILPNTYVSFPLRFMEGFAEYRDLIGSAGRESAEIFSVCESWLPDWRPGRDPQDGYWAQPGSGGVLLELIHEFDYLRVLLGTLNILDISDLSRDALGLAVPERISARGSGPSGEIVTINLDFSSTQSCRYSSYSDQNTFGRWDLLENTLEIVANGRRTLTNFSSDSDRNRLFRKQYEELFSPGTHPISVCSLEDALELNRDILRAWEEN